MEKKLKAATGGVHMPKGIGSARNPVGAGVAGDEALAVS